MKARFNLPEFFMAKNIYFCLMDVSRQYPEVLRPNTEIHAIFGNFPGSIWNGGGLNVAGNVPKEEIEETIHFFNYELGLPLRFTFTNPLIGPRQYYDTYSNIIAEVGNNGKNQILTSNLGLEKYLRDNYPNYKYCRSILAAEDEPYTLSSPWGPYYLSVMRRNMNNNWEYLETIPMEHRTSIEFLCCDPCPDNCPRLYTHYRDFSRAQNQLSLGGEECYCSMSEAKTFFQMHNMETKLKTFISRETIDNNYLPRGFNEFKLSGRSSIRGVVFNILTYLIQPEYVHDMFYELLGAADIT